MTFTYHVVTLTIKGLIRLLCRVDDTQLARVPDRGPLVILVNHINSWRCHSSTLTCSRDRWSAFLPPRQATSVARNLHSMASGNDRETGALRRMYVRM